MTVTIEELISTYYRHLDETKAYDQRSAMRAVLAKLEPVIAEAYAAGGSMDNFVPITKDEAADYARRIRAQIEGEGA